ncbi:MAG: hypothetical protein P8M17_10860 [Saprospiraceae bacterium]|jgi:hypothetical protein|nr:hypothetical protein [Saprospiraceae bacterium]MDC3253720.1 hypothetical protein [bacterium]MDG1436145.1 hypothetical protein [Saprospiraceae bacterium]MDG2419483.1 hypothetical protein [Saprospiraceae bacterium]
MKKYLLFSVLLIIVSIGCKEVDEVIDDIPYAVGISIEQPLANSIININEAMSVKVNFTRDAEEVIHHVKIFIQDSDGNTIETLLEAHAHTAGSFSYENLTAYIPTVAGTYKIRAVSHDMDVVYADPLEVEFTVQ